MKKTFIILIAVLVLIAISVTILNVSATDATYEAVVEETEESVVEGAETADETVTEAPALEDSAEESVNVDAEILMGAVSGSQSKTEAVLKIAEIFGISLSDAEVLVNGFVAFGDEHFEESDMWLTIRDDIVTHPDKWTIIAIVALGFVALMVFLIRSLIKNTLTQTNTKLKLADIDDHQMASDRKLESLDADNKEIKELIGGVKALLEGESEELKRENEGLKELLVAVRDLIENESAAVDSLKANSETSLKVTEESALQILQLINIAMDRKVPITTREARKLWYDDAVAKVKAKAGLTDAEAGESGE